MIINCSNCSFEATNVVERRNATNWTTLIPLNLSDTLCPRVDRMQGRRICRKGYVSPTVAIFLGSRSQMLHRDLDPRLSARG